jgi:hypothetical protein
MQQLYSCPNCNSPVTFGDRFCGTCGINLNWPAQQQMPPNYQQPPPGSQYQHYQQPGWGQPPPWGQPPGWGPYSGQQQQNIYGYGARPPKKQGSSSGFVLLIILVIIMMLAGAIGVMTGGTFDIGDLNIISSSSTPSGGTSPTSPSSDNTTQPAAPEEIAITVTELIEAYNTDSSAAETEYKGKTCKITGVVAGSSIIEPYFVLLTSSGSPDESGAKCMFAQTYLSKIQELELGQTVTIKGGVGDYGADVVVNDCIFVE